ncbi:heterokaryon incompatibility protein-domain-containing protein [Rhexocercosporidium sp. MPI-PUGE-AT-0058]|nr:heterokaryon incompatibility protein-domain-containing protein [Rhexocercosporidium sp. MPI-PUGE-AT-0058]
MTASQGLPYRGRIEDAYIYQGLQKREIRLFKLAPALFNDTPISVELFSCSLDATNLVEYETISYLWGGAEDRCEIFCDEKRLRIPKNLSDALLYLRNRYQPRIFWTDTISINQGDDGEKNIQIGLMASIHRQATRSSFWAGLELPSTRPAFMLLSKLRKARNAVFKDSVVSSLQETSDFRHLEDYRRRLPPPASPDWKSLEELLDARILTRHPNVIKSPGLQIILQFENLRRRFCEKRELTLDMLLDVTRSLKATNWRDNIYACYGIFHLAAPYASEAFPLPDYKLEIKDLYRIIGRALSSGGGFGPTHSSFSMIEDSNRRESDSDLLSWMPDWSKPLHRYRLNQMKCHFQASGNILPSVSQQPSRTNTGAELFDGLVIDRVDKVSSFLPPRRPYDKFNISGANAFFFLEWFEWVEEHALRDYEGDRDRLLLDWIETVQAKGCDVWRDPSWSDSACVLSQVRKWLKYLEDEKKEETEQIRQLHAAALPSHGRRFAITSRGHFCLVPRGTQPNDAICILHGAKVPFVLRERVMKSKMVAENWKNVGECYVHGAMLGEALKWQGVQEVTFDIR